jgi:iron(III) transport system substrate-binding protein
MRKPLIAGALVPMVWLAAACGGSPTTATSDSGGDAGDVGEHAQQVYDEINGLEGDARTSRLVELAAEEGALSVYTSNTDIDDLVDGFEDQYDIDVSVYRGNSESVLQRVLQEQAANFHGVDLVETNALELNVLNEEGFLSPYEGELRDSVREEGRADGWTANRFNVFVVGWNTDKVGASEEPKTLQELTDPKWKGQVSMEVGDVDWFAALYNHYLDQGMSEDEVESMFQKLASNSKIVKGHTVQGELLSAGQFSAAVSLYSHTVDKAEDKGAPVAWRPQSGEPVQPLVIRPNGAGLMKTATSPASAMLFMDWLLTEGQDIVAESFRIGSVPTAEDPLEGLEVIPVPEEELLAEGQKWDKLYERIVQGGQEVAE